MKKNKYIKLYQYIKKEMLKLFDFHKNNAFS